MHDEEAASIRQGWKTDGSDKLYSALPALQVIRIQIPNYPPTMLHYIRMVNWPHGSGVTRINSHRVRAGSRQTMRLVNNPLGGPTALGMHIY